MNGVRFLPSQHRFDYVYNMRRQNEGVNTGRIDPGFAIKLPQGAVTHDGVNANFSPLTAFARRPMSASPSPDLSMGQRVAPGLTTPPIGSLGSSISQLQQREMANVIPMDTGDKNPMSAQALGGIGSAVQGIAGIVSGIVGGRQRRQEQRDAKSMYESELAGYQALDTSNAYANITNPFEDLTVNQQQAQFEAQQQQQGLANVLSQQSAAAGGSGIAALAQAMANQQSVNLQRSSASIGQQETANQRLAAQGEARRQQLIAQGQNISQQMEAGKQGQLLGLADERLREANLARQQATQALVGGIGNLATGAVSIATGGGFGG